MVCLIVLKGRVSCSCWVESGVWGSRIGDGERGWPVALTRVQVGSRHRAVGRERSWPRYSVKARIMGFADGLL